MKIVLSLIYLITPIFLTGQIATEAQIPFMLNSDGDALINVIDTDDDNDGVLDNDDFSPLDPNTTTHPMLTTSVTTSADAGLRNNSGTAANQNYGTEATSNVLEYDTIKLTSSPLIINKSITIVSLKKDIYVQNCTTGNIETSVGKTISFNNFYVLSNNFVNNANLNCTDMVFKSKDGQSTMQFMNKPNATLQINNVVRLE